MVENLAQTNGAMLILAAIRKPTKPGYSDILKGYRFYRKARVVKEGPSMEIMQKAYEALKEFYPDPQEAVKFVVEFKVERIEDSSPAD